MREFLRNGPLWFALAAGLILAVAGSANLRASASSDEHCVALESEIREARDWLEGNIRMVHKFRAVDSAYHWRMALWFEHCD